MPIVLIGVGGFFGAIARYLVDLNVSERTSGGFPWGTLTVNLSGAFALGILFAITAERGILPAEVRGPVLIGFIGAYTTFSTLMLESWRLAETGAPLLGLANIVASSILGIVAVAGGLAIGRNI